MAISEEILFEENSSKLNDIIKKLVTPSLNNIIGFITLINKII